MSCVCSELPDRGEKVFIADHAVISPEIMAFVFPDRGLFLAGVWSAGLGRQLRLECAERSAQAKSRSQQSRKH